MRSKLQRIRFFSHSVGDVTKQLTSRMPNFLFERRKNIGYEFFDVSSGENIQVMMFVGALNNNTDSPMSDHLPMLQLVNQELVPVLTAKNVDFRLIATGYADVLEGLMDCYRITQRYQLHSPLLYIREVPKTEAMHGQLTVSQFQDRSFIVTPGGLIADQLNHCDYPSVIDRCSKIVDAVDKLQEEVTVKRFS